MPDLMWLEYAGCSRRMKELILLTDWPPRSPDLNPVEPLWDMKLRSISLLLTLSRSSVTPWSRTGRKDPPEDHHSFHSDHVWLHKLLFQTTEYHFDFFFDFFFFALLLHYFSLYKEFVCRDRPLSNGPLQGNTATIENIHFRTVLNQSRKWLQIWFFLKVSHFQPFPSIQPRVCLCLCLCDHPWYTSLWMCLF